MRNFNQQLQNTWSNKNTQHSCLTGKPEAENPKYHIMYHGYHVKILIQRLVPQALSTIQSSHTNKMKSAIPCTDFCPPGSPPPLRNPSWLQRPIQCNPTLLDCIIIIGNSNVYVDAIHASLVVTTNSPSCPFTYLSTRSPLDLTCTVLNCCIVQLINELLFSELII